MHVQIVNFNLEGFAETDYAQLCEKLAPSFADIPGLLAKFWLADPETNTYGGVYLWRDSQACEAYIHSDMFAGVASNPRLTNLRSQVFSVLEAPSEVTNAFRFAEVG